jgi:hypothetical protein
MGTSRYICREPPVIAVEVQLTLKEADNSIVTTRLQNGLFILISCVNRSCPHHLFLQMAQGRENPNMLLELADDNPNSDVEDDACWLIAALRREPPLELDGNSLGEGAETVRGEFSEGGSKAGFGGTDPNTSVSASPSYTAKRRTLITCFQCRAPFTTEEEFTYVSHPDL